MSSVPYEDYPVLVSPSNYVRLNIQPLTCAGSRDLLEVLFRGVPTLEDSVVQPFEEAVAKYFDFREQTTVLRLQSHSLADGGEILYVTDAKDLVNRFGRLLRLRFPRKAASNLSSLELDAKSYHAKELGILITCVELAEITLDSGEVKPLCAWIVQRKDDYVPMLYLSDSNDIRRFFTVYPAVIKDYDYLTVLSSIGELTANDALQFLQDDKDGWRIVWSQQQTQNGYQGDYLRDKDGRKLHFLGQANVPLAPKGASYYSVVNEKLFIH